VIRIGMPYSTSAGQGVAAGGQNETFIAGIYGAAGSPSGGDAVYITSGGQLYAETSSIRFKTEVREIGNDSDVLLQLRPVAFKYKPEYGDSTAQQYGLIAEEVEQVDPDLVSRDSEGQPHSVHYELVNALLLNEVQRLHQQDGALQMQVANQAAAIDALQASNQALLAAVRDLTMRLQAVERRPRTP
jgi:hypothetical protein